MKLETLVRYLRKLQSFADRPWYLPFISFLGGVDLFVLVIPTDGLLVSYVMLRPKQWVRAFLMLSLGCALGCWVLAALVQSGAAWFTYQSLIDRIGPSTWNWVDGFVENNGTLALAVLALLPLPQFPGVVIAALMGMPATTIFVAVLIGRLVKFSLLAYGASHAPKLLMKFPLLRKEITTFTGPPPAA